MFLLSETKSFHFGSTHLHVRYRSIYNGPKYLPPVKKKKVLTASTAVKNGLKGPTKITQMFIKFV